MYLYALFSCYFYKYSSDCEYMYKIDILKIYQSVPLMKKIIEAEIYTNHNDYVSRACEVWYFSRNWSDKNLPASFL